MRGDVPLRMARCSLDVVVFSRLAFPLREPSKILGIGVRGGVSMTDHPSGRGGGPMVGPSWFEGVGGRVMSQGYMQQTRNDSLQGLLESLRGQDKEKDVCRRIERETFH